MSRGNCPICSAPIKMSNPLMKCGNCGNVFCKRFCGKGLNGNKCPACGSKAHKV